MLKRKWWLAGFGALLVPLSIGVGMALGAESSWLASDDPTLRKIIDVPANISPVASNGDCMKVTTKLYGSRSIDDCVVQTPIATFGSSGITFNGSDYTAPITTDWSPLNLQGIPYQSTTYILNYGSVKGNYLSFYRSFLSSLKPELQDVNSRQQYVVAAQPDFRLRGPDGKLVEINASSMTFSENGEWMVVEVYGVGFVRINTTTFEVTTFAPSINPNPTDYAIYYSQLAITNDGRYAAIKPTGSQSFSIYDVDSCQNTAATVSAPGSTCRSREYYGYISSHIADFNNAYQLRFSSDDNLNFLSVANDPGNSTATTKKYTLAEYTMTAPGKSSFGSQYLAMGDSFASGQGAYSYELGTDTANNGCHTSTVSYPFLLRSDTLTDIHSVACSGAVTNDITSDSQDYRGQVHDGVIRSKRLNVGEILANYTPGYLAQKEFVDTYNPSVITLSIGGNDIGFADIVKKCVLPSITQSSCYSSKEDQTELINRINSVATKLAMAYKTVLAPGRHVYIIGYPQIVASGGNCANNVHLDASEIDLFIGLTNQLNKVIRQTAEANGATYVDVSGAFVGHRMCEAKSSQVAVNGLTAGNDSGIGILKIIGAESYHPNVLGHQLLAQAIRRQLGDLGLTGTSSTGATAPDANITLPLSDAPPSGRPLSNTVAQASLTPDVLEAGDTVSVTGDTGVALFKPSSAVKVMIDRAAAAGTGTVDVLGQATANFTLPDVPPGLHTVSVSGTTLAGQPIEITKEVFVTASGNASGGLGAWGCVPAAGVDADKDGIDDACDPLIGDPPALAQYVVHLNGSSIHAHK